MMRRKSLHAASKDLAFDAEEEEHSELLEAFNDKNLSHEDFLKMVKECKDEKSIKKLRRVLCKFE